MMEIKDWILMIVPIVANGLLIYIIQSFFNNESRQQFQDYINTLFKLICDASECYVKEI